MTGEWDALRAEAAHEYARAVSAARRDEENARARLQEAKEALDGMKAVRYDSQGGAGYTAAGDDAMFARIERMQAAAEAWAERADDYAGMLEGFQESLERMQEPRHRHMIVARYVDGMTLEQVAESLGFATQTMKNRRTAALCDLYDAMPERYKIALPDALW